MRDEELRELRRAAEAEGCGASWSRFAAGLARAGRWEDAGEALVRARTLGEADPSVEDSLEEASIDGAQVVRVAGSLEPTPPLPHGAVAPAAWSPDSRTLATITRSVVVQAKAPAWRLEPVLVLPNAPARTALALGLDGATIATGFPDREPHQARVRLQKPNEVASELVIESRRAPDVREIALWTRGGVVVSTGHEVVACREGQPVPTADSPRGNVTLAWDGTAVFWGEAEATLLDPLGGRAIEVAARALPESRFHLVLTSLVVPTRRAASSLARHLEYVHRLQEVRAIPAGIQRLAVSPAGRHLALHESSATTVVLVDTALGRVRRVEVGAAPTGLAWAPCGRRVAVPCRESVVVVELGASGGSPA